MATTKSGPRKRSEIVVTPTTEQRMAALAARIWAEISVAPQVSEGKDEPDAAQVKVAYDKTSDALSKLMDGLRKERDNAKPTLRARLDTTDVLADAVGKTMGELQGAYIKLPIARDEAGNVTFEDRINIPRLRRFSEQVGHPYHSAAVEFLKANKLKFVTGEKPAIGIAATTLESTAKPRQSVGRTAA